MKESSASLIENLLIGYKNLDLLEPHNLVPPGVFTLEGLLKYGEDHKQCPYFSARRMVRGMQASSARADQRRCRIAT